MAVTSGVPGRPFRNRLPMVLEREGIGECTVIADRIGLDPDRMRQIVLGEIAGTEEEWRNTIAQTNLLAKNHVDDYPYSEDYLLGDNRERFYREWGLQRSSAFVEIDQDEGSVAVLKPESVVEPMQPITRSRDALVMRLRENHARLVAAVEAANAAKGESSAVIPRYTIFTPSLVSPPQSER